MITETSNLSPKLFESDIEQKPSREGYGTGLVELGSANPNVVVLCADLSESTKTEGFAQKFPQRFFEMGVAEQNMATVAAGFGISGKIAFISSYATFSPGRNWEQIRTTIAYNDANVKVAGHHTGISVGPDGATHQATEDIALMRAMPRMRVIVPADVYQAHKATIAAASLWGPVYLRFAREKSPVFTTGQTPFTPGKADIYWNSTKPQAVIIGCGPLLYNGLVAAAELEKERVNTMVINCHTIKPIDEKAIIAAAKKAGAVVTVEEHQVTGGLGGAVAEVLARHAPCPIEFIGMQDTFGESGAPSQLIEKYGMGVKHIKAAVKRVVRRAH